MAAPNEWGFEQVTPVNKGGGNVQSIDTFQTRADGRAFLLSASAPFEGVPAESAPLYTRYLAGRTGDGWVNRALDVPFDPIPPVTNSALMTVVGTSHNLAFAVVTSTRVLAPGAIAGGGNVYLRNTATGTYRLIAANPSNLLTQVMATTQGGLSVKYVSPDGRAVVFLSPVALVDGAAEAAEASTLYRWTEADGLKLVSKLPADEGGSGVLVASAVGYSPEDETRQSLPRVGGEHDIYFSSLVETPQGRTKGPAYRWSDGVVSVLSKSQIPGDPSPPVPADVRATTSNGDFALVQTVMPARLTADTPTFAAGTPEAETSRVLYRFERGSGDLEYVGVSDVETQQAVEQMSQDGRTVVFKTQQQLTPDAAEFFGSGDPRNRRNLYAWRDGTLRFLTSFDPGARMNGTNWLRVLSENGRYFAFVDNSQSTASRFGIADNTSIKCASAGAILPAPCDQVYVFDVEQASLRCASCRPGGLPPKGQSGDPAIIQGPMLMNGRQVQTVADDGTVFFSSTEDLVESDSNGLLDVYAYRGGALRLVSGGVQGGAARFLDATPDGSSIFFATNARMTESDTDRSVDVYVTRLGAGYADQRPPTPPNCTGQDCRETSSERGLGAGGVGAGSETTEGPPPSRARAAKVRVRVTRLERRKGTLRVSVRTTGEGRLRISGSRIKTTVRNPRRAGDVIVSVPLSKQARATIKRRGRLRTRIRVSLSPPFGSAAVTKTTRTVR